MLFPLSKGMSSTRLFQSGGVNSDRVIRRTWHGGASGAADERKYEIHKLVVDRKPFSAHLRLAKSRAEDLRRQDAEFSKEHREGLREMQRRLDEQSQENKRAWMRGLRDARLRKADGAEDVAARLKEQQTTYFAARADMEARVRSLPKLCGEPPAKETAERTAQREARLRAVTDVTKQYVQERKEFQKTLAERPRSLSTGALRRPTAAVVEERKAAGLAQLSQAYKEYEATLQDVHDRHHQRILDERRQMREDFQGHLDFRLAAQDSLKAKHLAQQEQAKREAEERNERIRNRSKSFGGYSPKVKSDRRLREEAALEEIAAAASGAARRPG